MAVVLATAAWAADPRGTDGSRAALAQCQHAETMSDAERTEALRASLARADEAIAADDGDALGHFAAFCALGGLLKHDGLTFAAPGRLRRLRREVDRALELQPDFADALAGKGALLGNLPRLLGGDPAESERLLRRALEIDPDFLRPRLALVDALRDRGAVEEARAQATQALAIAERTGRPDAARTARAHLEALGVAPPNP
jgi:tetratricopeptide (TPR) repeat protein